MKVNSWDMYLKSNDNDIQSRFEIKLEML